MSESRSDPALGAAAPARGGTVPTGARSPLRRTSARFPVRISARAKARVVALAAALGGALALGACAQIRLLTYPDEFVWLGEGEVQGVMHSMAQRMARLDDLIGPGGESVADDPERRRRAVDAELAALEELGTALAADTAFENESSVPRTNHLLIDENIDAFVAEVARARRFVAEEPPNYYIVGRLSGSCNGCHRRRVEAF